LAGNGRSMVVFPLNELHLGRVKLSRSSNRHERELERENEKEARKEGSTH